MAQQVGICLDRSKAFIVSIIHGETRTATIISVFGPGSAKGELVREMDRIKPLRSHLMGLETTDKMALRQAELKVLEFYAMHPVAS